MVRRIRRGDSVIEAWDAGLPPPPEAYLPENRSTVLELIYFRWPEDGMSYRDQPHASAWMDALR
jgi:hypothetical protein